MITADDLRQYAITKERMILSIALQKLSTELMLKIKNSDIDGLSEDQLERTVLETAISLLEERTL